MHQHRCGEPEGVSLPCEHRSCRCIALWIKLWLLLAGIVLTYVVQLAYTASVPEAPSRGRWSSARARPRCRRGTAT